MDTSPVRNASASDGPGGASASARPPRKRFELLEECRELVLSRLVEIVAQALNQMSDELTAEALRSLRSDQQQALLDAVMLVRENRSEIESRFKRSFADVFERRMFSMAEAAGVPEPQGPIELALVPDDTIRDAISIDRLIGRARSKLDPEEVLGIRARFGALLERDWFEESRHPIAPEAVFEALKSALAELSPKPEVKSALLDAFEPHVSQNLNQVYAVVNERLRAHHVLPKIRPQVVPVGSGARRDPYAVPGAPGASGAPGAQHAHGAPVQLPPGVGPGGVPGPDGPWVAGSFGVVQPPAGHPGHAGHGGWGASPGGPGVHPGVAFATGGSLAGIALPPGAAFQPRTQGVAGGVDAGGHAGDHADGVGPGGHGGFGDYGGFGGGFSGGGEGGGFAGAGVAGDAPTAPSLDDGVAAVFEGAAGAGGESFANFERAMADASAGRPAGRIHVARMLTNPAMFGVADIPVAPVKRPLVASLTALQRAPEPEDVASLMPQMAQRVREQGSPLDQITVEIVSMVFDYIYADRRLPDPIKQQLLRLQVVAVKAALLDRSFFARRQHPMRRLIDRISEVGADPDADTTPDSPLIVGIGARIDRIIAEFDADLSIFEEAHEAIDALASEEAGRREARIGEVTREAARKEALETARDDARRELAAHLDKDSPAFVREFLHRWWTEVLANARVSAEGEAGEAAWRGALQTADWLVWSVTPKQSDEITRLARLLPGLIRGLNQGLATVEIGAEDRGAFFDELLRAHTLEIDAAKKRTSGSRPAVAVKLQPDGTVRFETRPTTEAAAAPAPVAASDALLAPLKRGDRIELTDDSDTRVFKLAWISPARKLFILSRHPNESLSYPAGEFAFMLQRGRVRVLDEGDTTLDRAIGSVTGGVSAAADGAPATPDDGRAAEQPAETA